MLSMIPHKTGQQALGLFFHQPENKVEIFLAAIIRIRHIAAVRTGQIHRKTSGSIIKTR